LITDDHGFITEAYDCPCDCSGECADDGVIELTVEEGQQLFDKAARELLGISGPEFIERYDRGEYDHGKYAGPDHHKICQLSVILPFGRA
jgi:hypothetical protein